MRTIILGFAAALIALPALAYDPFAPYGEDYDPLGPYEGQTVGSPAWRAVEERHWLEDRAMQPEPASDPYRFDFERPAPPASYDPYSQPTRDWTR